MASSRILSAAASAEHSVCEVLTEKKEDNYSAHPVVG
jgi:hypothetical protein